MNPRTRSPFLKTRIAFSLLFLGCVAAHASVSSDAGKAVIECLRSELGDMQGLSVPYERVILTSSTMLLGGGGAGDHATGLIHFEPPRALKIVQKTPRPETVIGDGETLWWYIPEKKEARRYPAEAMGQELEALADVFRGLGAVEESFEVIWEGHTEQGDRRVRLVPDPPWSQTDSIVLEVTPSCRLRAILWERFAKGHNGNIKKFSVPVVLK